MHTSNYSYHDDKLELQGFLAYDPSISEPRPAVLVFHDWSGCNEFACDKAKQLAEMGYVGFAIDMYGNGQLGTTVEEKQALINPFLSDQRLLRRRVQSALTAVNSIPEVDTTRVAVIGFCFGGLCALELARSGALLKGVVSFHGLLHQPGSLKSESIRAKVLVLHGYEDPMVPPEKVHEFCNEMTEAHVDWQMHMYGNVHHAFTNPQANDRKLGLLYDAVAARRSWQAMTYFMHEILGK